MILKKILEKKISIKIIDIFLGIFFIFTYPFFFTFYKFGSKRLVFTRNIFKLLGFYPIYNHYYQPNFKNNYSQIKKREILQKEKSFLDIKSQVLLLKKFKYERELKNIFTKNNEVNHDLLNINNRSFSSGDGEFLYQFIRFTKPNRVIEIGCGNSTLIISKALSLNNENENINSQLICIEPYENKWLESIVKNVMRIKVEDVPLKEFNKLKSGDLLFIDSSHILKPNQDVFFIYNHILPILKKGVYIHIHDIFTPKDYPKDWLLEDIRFWNEQYLLECILSSSNRYEVIAALNFLKHNRYKELKRVCPYLNKNREPGSIYLKVR